MDCCRLGSGNRWRMIQIATLASLVLILAACTRGRVVDPDDNDEYVGGADLEFFEWPHDDQSHIPWPSFGYPAAEYALMTASTGFNGREYNWAIKNFSGTGCSSDAVLQDDVLEVGGRDIFRIRIDREDYRPSFYYDFQPNWEPGEVFDCDNNEWVDPYPE